MALYEDVKGQFNLATETLAHVAEQLNCRTRLCAWHTTSRVAGAPWRTRR